MPVLHQIQISGNSYKVRLIARQLGIELALKDYALDDGSTRTPDFLAKNPSGRLPLLEFDDGRMLPESGAILWYLSEDTKLLPSDRWGHAEVLHWMFFEQHSHAPYIGGARYWLSLARKEDLEKRRNLVPELHARGNAALGVMEAHLAHHEWFAGERYSIADIALYAVTHCAADGGFDLGAYPAVGAWLSRVASQPGHIPLEARW